MIKSLHLVLKHKWFDMIASGEKLEEYREIKPYWQERLFSSALSIDGMPVLSWEIEGEKYSITPIPFDSIIFHRGYSKTTIEIEYISLSVGQSLPKWSENNESKRCFIIGLGKLFNREKFITEKFNALLIRARQNQKIFITPPITRENFMEHYERFMMS